MFKSRILHNIKIHEYGLAPLLMRKSYSKLILVIKLYLLTDFRLRFTLGVFILFLVQFGLLSGHLLANSCIKLGFTGVFIFSYFCSKT